MPLRFAIGANLDSFKDGMNEAVKIAEEKAAAVEKAFVDASPELNSKAMTSFLAGGAAIAGVVGVQKLLDALVEVNKQLSDMEGLAKRVGVSLAQFQELRFAANMKGVSDSDFATGIEAVAKKINEIRHGEEDLTTFLDKNNVKYKERDGSLVGATRMLQIAADLIKNASTELDKEKIADKFGLKKELIPALEEGGEEFMRLAGQARAAGVIIDAETIQKAKQFTAEWTKSTTQWSASFRASLSEIIPILDSLVGMASKLTYVVGQAGGIIAGFGRALSGGFEALTLEDINRLLLLEKQGTALYDKLVERKYALQNQNAELDDRGRGSQLTTITVRPNGTKGLDKPKEEDGGSPDAFDREVDRIKRRTALLEADTAAVGKNTGEREALRAELVLLQAAEKVLRETDSDQADVMLKQIDAYTKLRATMSSQQALQASGIRLDEEKAESFRKVTDRTAQVATGLETAKRSFEGVNESARFAGNQLVSSIEGILDKTQSLSSAGVAALKAFRNELLRAAITGEGALAKLFGLASTTPGGTGGLFGLLLKGFKGGGGADNGALTNDDYTIMEDTHSIQTLAAGGDIPPGGLAYVGEHGPNPRLIRAGNTPIRVTPGEPGGGGLNFGDTVINVAGNMDDGAMRQIRMELASHRQAIVNMSRGARAQSHFQGTGVRTA